MIKYKEEIYARRLYLDLKRKFSGEKTLIAKILKFIRRDSSNLETVISIDGAGVHWHCLVSKGNRRCCINCFDINFTDLYYRGPEYYTSFEINRQVKARGRTFDKNATIKAVEEWLENATLNNLYSHFPFIDEKKRKLENIRTEIITANPLLSANSPKVVEEQFSSYSLWFKNENRGCRIYYYGYEQNPRYIFYWDDCVIFETSDLDKDKLGLLVNRWVHEKASPSILAKAYPGIDFGKLGEYYEKGKGVEGEYVLSWDRIEAFYEDIDLNRRDEVIELIKRIRSEGFDRTLRAGQSLYTLILSRSRRHGLRENQDSISFSFNFIKSAMEVRMGDSTKLEFDKIEYNDKIERLLKQLEQLPID